MAALIYLITVIALTLLPPAGPKAVGLQEGPVTQGPAPTQTAGVREVSVTVAEGQNVTLLCRASGIDEDATINWTRGNQTIFLYRDGLPDPDGQHPSYVGRVKLVDQSPTENGDLSVILMNVSSSDIGTFKCSIKDPKDKVIKDLGTVHLSVLVSGPDWVLIIGLTAAGLVVICVSVVIGLVVKKRLLKKKSEQPAAEEQPLSSSEPVEVQCESKV